MNARFEGVPSTRQCPLFVVAGALAIAGCNMADDSAKDMAAPAGKAATETAPAVAKPPTQPARARVDEIDALPASPAPAKPGDVSRAWFAGSWTDSGDCAHAGRFAPNGTYLLADGTRGMWSVQDDRLVVQHAEGRSALRLRRIDQNTVEVANDDGSIGRSTRCG